MSLRKMFKFQFDPGVTWVVSVLVATGVFAACEMATAPHVLVDEELAPLPVCPECVIPELECPSPVAAAAPSPTAPLAKVDLNHATPTQLETLPGVGPGTAQRIIEHRSRRPFRKIRDLTRVKGIGRRKYLKLKPHVHVTPRAAPKIRRPEG